uniref:Uncharacterized protein n=1 Tax=Marmota marmota marmota TaxID=9994 RepID=A0A8C5Z0R8_MARMA
ITFPEMISLSYKQTYYLETTSHHGSHDVEVGEVDTQPPGQVEEDKQCAGQPLAEDPIGADRGHPESGSYSQCP